MLCFLGFKNSIFTPYLQLGININLIIGVKQNACHLKIFHFPNLFTVANKYKHIIAKKHKDFHCTETQPDFTDDELALR